jgi:hypothetical protein
MHKARRGDLMIPLKRETDKEGKKIEDAASKKIKINKEEMNKGELHSGSKHGPLVTNPKQAIAISFSQARRGIR